MWGQAIGLVGGFLLNKPADDSRRHTPCHCSVGGGTEIRERDTENDICLIATDKQPEFSEESISIHAQTHECLLEEK